MLSAFGIMLILKHIECQTILFRRLSARLSAVSTARCRLCRKGCPIANDIPDWIGELAKGNFGNAMKNNQHPQQSSLLSAAASADMSGSAKGVACSARKVRPSI